MHFRTQHSYDASPERVYAMLTDAEFLGGMMTSPSIQDHQVSVDGSHTVVRASLAAPAQVARFTGNTLQVTLDIDWATASPDGGRRGPIVVSVAKLPAKLAGTATLAPQGAGTTVTYEGEFSVSLPLVGGKLEGMAAPYITRVLDAQQTTGRAWLAAHPA